MKRKLPFTDSVSNHKKQKILDDNTPYNKQWIEEQNSNTDWQIRFSLKYYYLKYYLNGYLEKAQGNEKCIEYGNAYTKYKTSDFIRYIRVKDCDDSIKYEGKLVQLVWNGCDGFYYHIFQYTKTHKDKNNTKSTIFYHKLGHKMDHLIYQNERKECDNILQNVTLTEDGTYMIINKYYTNETKDKTKIINLKTNQQHYVCGSLTYIINRNELFYFITHKDTPNNKLITLNIQKPDEKYWTTLVPENVMY